jgi:hypothetical protein
MKSSGPDWTSVTADLARHLAAASVLEQVQRILGDAERDLSRLDAPRDFWQRVRQAYRTMSRQRAADETLCEVVEPLLTARCSPECPIDG